MVAGKDLYLVTALRPDEDKKDIGYPATLNQLVLQPTNYSLSIPIGTSRCWAHRAIDSDLRSSYRHLERLTNWRWKRLLVVPIGYKGSQVPSPLCKEMERKGT